jgi:hypothetical protein
MSDAALLTLIVVAFVIALVVGFFVVVHQICSEPGEWCWRRSAESRSSRPLGAPGAGAAQRTGRVALPNVSSRRERRERTNPLANAAFPILDEFEEEDWESRNAGKDSIDDQAASDADFFAGLLLACGNDSAVLPDVIQVGTKPAGNPSTPVGTTIERAIPSWTARRSTSEALGHSSVSFTMDTYQHLMPTDAATRAIEDAIGGTVAAGLDDA